MLKLYTRADLLKSLNERVMYYESKYSEALQHLINAADTRQGTNALKTYADQLIYNQTEIDRLEAQIHIVEMTEQA